MEVDKKSIDIIIRKKTFKISFVSNWVIYQYEQLNRKLVKLQELYNSLEKLPNKIEIKKIADEITDMGASLHAERLEIVEELITSNDMKFDLNFWERKTDVSDIMGFINQCAFKDTILSKKKVK